MSTRKLVEETCAAAVESVEVVQSAFAAFPWEKPEAYANWLAQIYHYVRHATRLLAFAAARCDLSQEGLHKSCLKGIREEAGHEDLAARDLRHLGFDLARLPEMPETIAYRQTLYYAIDHDGPAALIGYFLPLEGLAARKLRVELPRVVARYSPKGTNFLRVHCELDVDHFDDGLAVLDGMSAPELEVVKRHLASSAVIYGRMVERIARATLDKAA